MQVGQGNNCGAQVTVVFDQSPLIDECAERERDRADVVEGFMAKWEYRVKWYGETEDKAKAAIAEIDGTQTEDMMLSFGAGG